MAKKFSLAPLPYEQSALEPVISAKTLSFHYGKHHQKYVDTLSDLVEGTKFADMKLEEIVKATTGSSDAGDKKIFNNAGQVWNHDFYWRSLSPKETKPTGALKEAIERDFGGVEKLVKEFAAAGAGQFGSGWAWLTSNGGRLAIDKTLNAENPMGKGTNCLLTIDVWEHAYYLDYQNARPKYLEEVLAKLINWNYAAENLAKESTPVRSAV